LLPAAILPPAPVAPGNGRRQGAQKRTPSPAQPWPIICA
jgi:hypothetical protein